MAVSLKHIRSGHILGITLAVVDGAARKVGLEAIAVGVGVHVPERDGTQVAGPRLINLLDILM